MPDIYKVIDQATDLLKRLKIKEPPVNVEAIAEKLKINIEHDDLDDDVSGFLILKKNNHTIVVNENHPSNRQRFTIAHEIGHFVLHANNGKELFIDKKYARDINSSTGEINEEMEANSFAAELLMPAQMLKDELVSSGFNVFDDMATFALAKKFRVSEQALGYRLGKLDLGFDN
jgi:Zn-dependent peptidase ImmA (M78 family)